VGFGLAFALFFSGAPNAVLITLLGLQVFQIILVSVNPTTPGGVWVSALLIGQAVSQIIAFVITAQTPLKSTGSHVTSTISGAFLFAAILLVNSSQPSFVYNVAPALATNSLLFWGLIITCVAGLIVTCRSFPRTQNNWRSSLSNVIWTVTYFILVSAKRFP